MKDWGNFHNITKYIPPRKNIINFINTYKLVGDAIDLGCGARNDTVYLIKNNWNVLAIDGTNSEMQIRNKLLDNEQEKLIEIFKEDSWIIDGNYQRTIEMRLKECDTVFLLDFPTDICIEGAMSRIGKKRDDLPWVEKKLDENFKQVIIDFPKSKLPQIYELLNKYKNNINIFKSRDEADNFITNIKV